MTIEAVVFDIGGILEITPDLGWAPALGVPARPGGGRLGERMADAWRGGEIGTVTEAEVRQAAGERLGLDEGQLAAFMADLWRDYLGDGQHRADRVRARAAPALPDRDPQQQLRRRQGARAGRLRLRGPS